MRPNVILLLAAVVLPGCSTTASRSAASAKEIDQCKAMDAAMGTSRAHSHAETKGAIISTPMNTKHQRCRTILASQPK